MSILLDALKKSESQRQRGEATGINDPVAGEAMQGAARKKWIPVVLVALSAVIMAWIGWQQLREPDAGASLAEHPATAAAGQSEVAPAEEQGKLEASNGDTPATVQPGARRTPVEALPPGLASNTKGSAAPPEPAHQAEPRKTRVNESFTTFENAAQAATAGETAPVVAPSGDSTAAVAKDEPARKQGAPSGNTRVTQPISFWELPQGIRDGLPDLRITVLVYAEKAEDRFLLLGGRRLFEKDEVQEGVVLEEIRRDGAVFLYRNYRFLVEG
jgi:general secretion pathway protein B